MREVERIEGEIRKSWEGKAWHGPSLLELLDDVTADQARARPVPDAHSIWELVVHCTAWQRAALGGIAGAKVDLSPEEDWSSVKDGNEPAWTKALQELEDTNQQLRRAVLEMDGTRLDEVVAGRDYTVYVLLQGVVQHNLYHAGQIALLKKGR
jgi:uncharacterized damage-inducible protein DinB